MNSIEERRKQDSAEERPQGGDKKTAFQEEDAI
jgi:hypothetical protein